jgi:serine/threonine protein kinase
MKEGGKEDRQPNIHETISRKKTCPPRSGTISHRETMRALAKGTISGKSTVYGALPNSATDTISGRSTVAPKGQTQATIPAEQVPPFTLLAELGHGGMGVVYKSRQTSLRREIAVKSLISKDMKEEDIQAFIEESLVTGLLDHPNIVPVHDLVLAPNGEWLLAMKMVKGQSWADALEKHKADDMQVAVNELIRNLDRLDAVCSAVNFAHSKGIVHLDLKPENVMLGDFDEILLMDWGIAADFWPDEKRQEPVIRKTSTVDECQGTPAYMPPELADGEGEKVGPQTDIFLLGAILYELVKGQPPYSDPWPKILLRATECDFEPLSDNFPHRLRALCERAMKKEPKERFANIEDFQTELRKARDSLRNGILSKEKLSAARVSLTKYEQEGSAHDEAWHFSRLAEIETLLIASLELDSENSEADDLLAELRRFIAEKAIDSNNLSLAEIALGNLERSQKSTGGSELRGRLEEKWNSNDPSRNDRLSLSSKAFMIAPTLTAFYYLSGILYSKSSNLFEPQNKEIITGVLIGLGVLVGLHTIMQVYCLVQIERVRRGYLRAYKKLAVLSYLFFFFNVISLNLPGFFIALLFTTTVSALGAQGFYWRYRD